MTAPAIAGCLVVDISRHIDEYGIPTQGAGRAAWRALAAAPPGISVRLSIGTLRALDACGLMSGLIDGGILKARDVIVEGAEPEGIEVIMTELRRYRDSEAAA